ncbi:hypothetical protein JCM33374_g824 [Metschnikowia sp. JCM 33374]|nr:hypothetical protein JCM33374_g824 [Metschnikowia sp. JCM 33374]
MESSKSQIRSQLLASENAIPQHSDINTMSGFASQGQNHQPGAHHPMHYQNTQSPRDAHMGGQPNHNTYSNHDLVTPLLKTSPHPSGPSSRKASMTSMSVQRFFRRKDNSGGQFDEDMGADFGDISGSDMSFNDIAHLRGAGRYNTSTLGNLDTAPIIPVLGMPGAGGTKSLNNVQYRKFMNHQKKLNLAQSARAMSLAGGGNPITGQDSRSMSFTNTPSSRANSLGAPLNGAGAPNSRAMSLNSNPMLRGQQNQSHGPYPSRTYAPMNGQGPQYPQNAVGHQHSPNQNNPYPGRNVHKTPPMRQPMQFSGPASPQHQGNNSAMPLRSGVPQSFRKSPQGPRSNSLTNNGMHTSPNQGVSYGQKTQSMTNAQGFQPVNQRNVMTIPQGSHQNSFQHNNSSFNSHMSGTEKNQYSQPFSIHVPNMTSTSTDSLTNVLEEDEEEENIKTTLNSESRSSSFQFGGSTSAPPPLSASKADDHVYNFDENETPQLSRKSTVTKSNSMRVRKLDLFNAESSDSIDQGADDEMPRSGKILSLIDQPAKLKHSRSFFDLSDNASFEDSDFSDLEPKIPLRSSETKVSATNDSLNKSEPNQNNKNVQLKSLAQNTAFNKLRMAPSSSKTAMIPDLGVDNSLGTSIASRSDNLAGATLKVNQSLDGHHDHSSKEYSDSPSNFSNYSTDDPKQTETNPTQASIISDTNNVPQYNFKDGISNAQGKGHVSSKEVVDPNPNLSTGFFFSSGSIHRESSISRSNSELKSKGLVPSSALLRVNTSDSNLPIQDIEFDKREKRKSVSSISSKSRNLMKKLSLSNSKKTMVDDGEFEDHGHARKRVLSVASQKSTKPLTFTKEELSIMTCNNELQSELQLVTSELAFSIKRELALEARIRSKTGFNECPESQNLSANEDLEKSKVITELQEKLNKERKLRFISEEHAILAEHGQSPSALKLDYEKNEIYNQLLAKNEMVIQLQDKLDETLAANLSNSENDLVEKFNELLKENADLKTKLKPNEPLSKLNSELDSHSGDLDSEGFYHDGDQSLIVSLRTQRDELREMITNLTTSRNVELKVAQEKIKTLEAKLEKVNSINHKLSKRVDKSGHTSGAPRFSSGQGGKLQGFSIVTPSKKVFDE